MALGATIHLFDIDLVDHDRSCFESMALRVARHPSESDEYLVTRVLAYVLEYAEGIAFSSGGLSSPDDPAIAIRDLTGALQTWLEIGWPDADRLHRASKAAPRVVVYPHRDPGQWLRRLDPTRIHRAAAIDVRVIDGSLIADLAARLERRLAWNVTVSDGELFVSTADGEWRGVVTRPSLGAGEDVRR